MVCTCGHELIWHEKPATNAKMPCQWDKCYCSQFNPESEQAKVETPKSSVCQHFDREEIDFYLVLSKEFIKLVQCKGCKLWLLQAKPREGDKTKKRFNEWREGIGLPPV